MPFFHLAVSGAAPRTASIASLMDLKFRLKTVHGTAAVENEYELCQVAFHDKSLHYRRIRLCSFSVAQPFYR